MGKNSVDPKAYDSISIRSPRLAAPPLRAQSVRTCPWRVALPLFWLVLALVPLPARADDSGAAVFASKVDAVLARERLAPDQVALLILSVPGRTVLYSLRPDEPMIPASNAKLITSYAALRQLTPNYRWKTRFYWVEEDDGPGRPHRQGLLVEAGADPTLQRGDLEAIARTLKSLGVSALDGHLWYDAGILAGPSFPTAWGDVELDMPWYAQVTPFILNLNQAAFAVHVKPGAASPNGEPAEAQVFPLQPWPGAQVNAQITWIAEGRELVRVHQVPTAPELTFNVSGELLPNERTFTVATAIGDPLGQFLRQFRSALHEAGIEGALPLAPVEGANLVSVRNLFTQESEPLGAFLGQVNKDSNNLTAEILLRSLAFGPNRRGITSDDGLSVVRTVLAEDFPDSSQGIAVFDGSGLSRDDRVTAAFLVDLLDRVLSRFDFRSEFVNSLSVSGRDGTLLDHVLPRRYWGQIRAKTGTLKGVQNVSGYFNFGNRLLAFSFLIHDETKDAATLQRAQDRALAGILDAYLESILPPHPVKRGRPIPPLPPVAVKFAAPATAGSPKPSTGAGR
jgi:D-alanyl-D-alanine carboxypeptidase/D-alanyl-D-alanine-endopeptidase (penicillin-binding protein 4)